MPLAVVDDKSLDAVDIGPLGADGVMLAPDDVSHLIEQFGFVCRRRTGLSS